MPKPKRKYGYFSLPILVGDTFVARMDSKADRKQKVLTIFNLYFESIKLAAPTLDKVCASIMEFAKFNRCRSVEIKKTNDKRVLKILRTL